MAPTRLPEPSGLSASTPATSRLRQLGGARQGVLGHPRLPVDAEPHAHLAGGDVEEGLVGTRHRAATERDPERARAVVRATRDPLDPVEVVALLGCCAGHLEHDEVPGDAPAPAAPRSAGALAMSSVTKTTRVSMPSRRSRSCASVKFMTSPA